MRTSSGRFRYFVFAAISLWVVFGVVVVLLSLFGSVVYSGTKLFLLLFGAAFFLSLAVLLSYFVIVRRRAFYSRVGDGRDISLREAISIMRDDLMVLCGVMPSLDTYYAFLGDGFYGDEPTTHVSHALFRVSGGFGKNEFWLVAMQNAGSYAKQFHGFPSRLVLFRDVDRVLSDMISRLTVKPSNVESVVVTESNPLTGGVRTVRHRKPVVKQVPLKFNEEFVDKKFVDGGVVGGS